MMNSPTPSEIQEKLSGLMLMRFKISPSQSLDMVQQWLNSHQDEDIFFLFQCFKNQLVRIEENTIIDLYALNITKLVNDMRLSDGGLEIKNRHYRLVTYDQCFIGSEAVKWMQNRYGISKAEAINIGQQLIDAKIIHHVTDNHNFKDGDLFYRFYVDE
ncbi:MAG: hypothetical protein IGQ45_02780 [Cyanobacterium sp. T60_A2020_053]|nr:hypothetical protein [Cyanobacterium sp. T60_A2020_053]